MKRSAVLSALLVLASSGSALAADPSALAQTCTACHGDGAISQMKEVPSLAGQPEGFLQWQLVYFRSRTRKSEPMQTIVAGLTDRDIRALSAYFAALPPPTRDVSGEKDDAMYAVGQRLAAANRCASCHGDDYGGMQAAARTANQREDYLLKALRDFKQGKRTGGGVAAMGDVVYPLGDDQLRALAHYMAHLH